MGGWVSNLTRKYDLAETSLIGLDAAGKTTILYKLKRGEVVETTPSTVNVETIHVKNVKFDIMDFGGQEKIRFMWSKYSCRCQCIIFVVDSTDRRRVDMAREMLHEAATNYNMKNSPLLVFANKQDSSRETASSDPFVMPLAEIAEKLALHKVRDRSTYAIYPCSAITGKGLREGLEWLAETFSRIGEKRSKPFVGGAW